MEHSDVATHGIIPLDIVDGGAAKTCRRLYDGSWSKFYKCRVCVHYKDGTTNTHTTPMIDGSVGDKQTRTPLWKLVVDRLLMRQSFQSECARVKKVVLVRHTNTVLTPKYLRRPPSHLERGSVRVTHMPHDHDSMVFCESRGGMDDVSEGVLVKVFDGNGRCCTYAPMRFDDTFFNHLAMHERLPTRMRPHVASYCTRQCRMCGGLGDVVVYWPEGARARYPVAADLSSIEYMYLPPVSS